LALELIERLNEMNSKNIFLGKWVRWVTLTNLAFSCANFQEPASLKHLETSGLAKTSHMIALHLQTNICT
jgi:hypothetical protein